MGIVTRHTGESTVAVAETGGTMQEPRLVAHIPDVGPIRIVIEIGRLPMARAAQRTDLKRGEPARILDWRPSGGPSVRTSRAVAGLTVNTRFARLNLEIAGECYRSRRVTAETAQRGFRRIEGTIDKI
jgi:hypothetical protein